MIVFNWKTEFNTSELLMIHTFSERVKVVTDLKNQTISYLKDGDLIDKFDCAEITLEEYENYLIEIAKCAETIKSFDS